MVYDNSRVAVAKRVGPSGKKPTEALLKLSIYYGFSLRFFDNYKANEKGHVERSVEYLRRRIFSKRDTFSSMLLNASTNSITYSILLQVSAN